MGKVGRTDEGHRNTQRLARAGAVPPLGLNIQGEEQGYQMLVPGGAREGVPEGAAVIEGLGHSQNCGTKTGREWGRQREKYLQLFLRAFTLSWCLPLIKPTGKLEDKGARGCCPYGQLLQAQRGAEDGRGPIWPRECHKQRVTSPPSNAPSCSPPTLSERYLPRLSEAIFRAALSPLKTPYCES